VLTATELRGYVTTALEDADLERLLSAAYESIVAFAGPSGATTELVTPHGDLLMLATRADSITSVTETVYGVETTLATDDYELIGDQTLRRANDGTHPYHCWRGRVKAVYVPLDDEENRDRVAIALVEQDLNHNPGLTGQRLGEWQESFAADADYQKGRAEILASLYPPFVAI
jgi:hypothetical protein